MSKVTKQTPTNVKTSTKVKSKRKGTRRKKRGPYQKRLKKNVAKQEQVVMTSVSRLRYLEIDVPAGAACYNGKGQLLGNILPKVDFIQQPAKAVTVLSKNGKVMQIEFHNPRTTFLGLVIAEMKSNLETSK